MAEACDCGDDILGRLDNLLDQAAAGADAAGLESLLPILAAGKVDPEAGSWLPREFCWPLLTDGALARLYEGLGRLTSGRPASTSLIAAGRLTRTALAGEVYRRLLRRSRPEDWPSLRRWATSGGPPLPPPRIPAELASLGLAAALGSVDELESSVTEHLQRMKGAAQSTWILVAFTNVPSWMARGFPRSISLDPHRRTPLEGQNVGQAMALQARGIKMTYGSGLEGAAVFMDDLGDSGLYPPTDGTSGGLSQTVLYRAVGANRQLPRNWAFIGDVQPTAGVLGPVDPATFRDKLESLAAYGGFETVWVASKQEASGAIPADLARELGLKVELLPPSAEQAVDTVLAALPSTAQEGEALEKARLIDSIRHETPGFAVRLWIDQGGATAVLTRDLRVLPKRETARYKMGDEIFLSVSVDRDSYLWILNLGSSGSLTVLFPNEWHGDNRLKARQVYRFPGPEYPFTWRLEPPPGVERIKAIATLESLSEDQILDLARGGGGQLAKVATRDIRVLGRRLRELPPDSWSEASLELSW